MVCVLEGGLARCTGLDPLTSSADTERAVYSALLATVTHDDTATVIVEDSTGHYDFSEAYIAQSFEDRYDAAPSSTLLHELHERSITAYSIQTVSLPSRVDVVTHAEARALQQSGSGGVMVYMVSPVALSVDQDEALVYFEQSCGPLCSSAHIAWLKRHENGEWSVDGMTEVWIS